MAMTEEMRRLLTEIRNELGFLSGSYMTDAQITGKEVKINATWLSDKIDLVLSIKPETPSETEEKPGKIRVEVEPFLSTNSENFLSTLQASVKPRTQFVFLTNAAFDINKVEAVIPDGSDSECGFVTVAERTYRVSWRAAQELMAAMLRQPLAINAAEPERRFSGKH
jgi:hypothetical protein